MKSVQTIMENIPNNPSLYERQIAKLRAKIKARTAELNIKPLHDEKGHWYEYQGQKYPSVTNRIGILKDPSLMNWKMNRALEVVDAALTAYKIEADDPTETEEEFKVREARLESIVKGNPIFHLGEIEQIIQDAKLAPQLEFEGAGDVGSQVHRWREAMFTEMINGKNHDEINIPVMDSLPVVSAIRAIDKFLKESGYIPLACELYLADHFLKLGGTLDDIGLIKGNLVLIDLKTSNIAEKDSYYAQVCLYLHMFRKLYKMRPKGVYILHVSKENGFYDLIPLHERVDINKTIRWAKKVVEVSQGLDELREAKKVKPVRL